MVKSNSLVAAIPCWNTQWFFGSVAIDNAPSMTAATAPQPNLRVLSNYIAGLKQAKA
jgi:hypothetical protein